VLDAQNKSSIGISGKIVDEAQKSVVMKLESAKLSVYKRIFKSGTLFRVALPNDERVELQGDEILGRPWERISK